MRVQFRVLAVVQVAQGAWTTETAAQIGEEIRAALDSGDDARIQAWADYLATEAAALGPMAQACREAEARIRAAAKQRQTA